MRPRNDDDPACTGAVQNPTAPAGKVCLYAGALGTTTFSGGYVYGDPALRTRAFFAVFETTAADIDSVWFTWAYTAP
jgi:hypothetical protein